MSKLKLRAEKSLESSLQKTAPFYEDASSLQY